MLADGAYEHMVGQIAPINLKNVAFREQRFLISRKDKAAGFNEFLLQYLFFWFLIYQS